MIVEPAYTAFETAYQAGAPQVVWTRLIDDLETPVSAYLKIGHGRPYAFLFESVEGGAFRARYSIITLNPDLVWRCRGDQAEIAEGASIPVVVDMWAPWCGPCRMVSPALEQVAAELAGRVKLVKVNVDDSPKLQQRFNVMAIPTLMMLRRGQVAARRAGAVPAASLCAWVEEVLGN